MSQRSILMLGVATLIVMLAALLLTAQREQATVDSGPLVPGLRAQINEIKAIDITGSDGQVIAVLRRRDERWLVENRDAYEADFRRVHDFLRELALAQRAEPRTAQDEWFARLGLADIGSADAGGVLVELPDTDLPAVILGHQDQTTGARFARLPDEPGTWLTDRSLSIPDRPVLWLERSVMDIPASELAEVTILHADGEQVRLRPADDDGDQWVLLDVPEGREAGPRWEIRPVANGLASVVLEDVRRHDGHIPDDAVRSLYVTRDGLNFIVSLFRDDAGAWAHFSVSAEPSAPHEDELSEADQALMIDAAAVDARLSPWQFALDRRKFEVMTRRLEALLAPIADPRT